MAIFRFEDLVINYPIVGLLAFGVYDKLISPPYKATFWQLSVALQIVIRDGQFDSFHSLLLVSIFPKTDPSPLHEIICATHIPQLQVLEPYIPQWLDNFSYITSHT